jgi:hypothetical protein
MIRAHTCYIPECDTPGCKPFEDAEYTPHFPTREEAIARLVKDWEWTDEDGILRCRDCTRRHQCEQTSHDWYDPNSAEDLLQFTRQYCRKCPATRPIAHQEVADAAAR